MNVLIVGAGMYVCGGNTEGNGTVLPTIIQMQKEGKVNEIHIAATKKNTVDICKFKRDKLDSLLDFSSNISFYPKNEKMDKIAFLKALQIIEKPVCAIIVVPDHMHYSITDQIMDLGVHCMVVKPFTQTTDEALKLISKAEKSNVWNGVEFHKRFDKANQLLKKIIKEKKIGDILYFLVEYSQRRVVPMEHFSDWALKTNVFQYLGVHYADILYYLTEALPKRVSATGQMQYLSGQGLNTYDSIQASIEWQYDDGNTFQSIISTNWIDTNNSTALSDQKIKVIGTEGRCESDQKDRGIKLITKSSAEDVNPYFSTLYLNRKGKYRIDGYGPDSIRQFIADTEKHSIGEQVETVAASFSDSLASVAITESVNKSLRNDSEWVQIDRTIF